MIKNVAHFKHITISDREILIYQSVYLYIKAIYQISKKVHHPFAYSIHCMYICCNFAYLYIMVSKYQRHSEIREIIASGNINSQNELLDILTAKGHMITQATLSRDLKELKASKVPGEKGNYKYVIADELLAKKPLMSYGGYNMSGFISIEFSKNLGIIKTMPAFSSTIAVAIDKANINEVLGTIAGDDTILIIAREGYTKYNVINALKMKFPALIEKI